jgi:hypothetical protein
MRGRAGSAAGEASVVDCQGSVKDGAAPEDEKGSDAVAVPLLFGTSPEGKGVEGHADGVGLTSGLAEERIPFPAGTGADAGVSGLDVGNGGCGEETERENHSGRACGVEPGFIVAREREGIGEVEAAAEQGAGLTVAGGAGRLCVAGLGLRSVRKPMLELDGWRRLRAWGGGRNDGVGRVLSANRSGKEKSEKK